MSSGSSPGAGAPYPGFLQALGLLLLVVIVQGIAALPFELAGSEGGPFDTERPGVLAAINLVAFGVVVAWAFRKTGAPWDDVFPAKRVAWGVLGLVVLTMVGESIVLSEVDNLTRLWFPPPESLARFFEGITDLERHPFGAVFALVVVAPLTEEALFRGVILRGFLRNYSTATAVVASSVLFGLLHVNPWQLVPATVGGLVLAWLVVETGSLIPAVLAHAVANGMGVVVALLPLEIPGYTGGLTGPVEFQPFWFTAGGVVLFGGGLLLLVRGFRQSRSSRRGTGVGRDDGSSAGPSDDGPQLSSGTTGSSL